MRELILNRINIIKSDTGGFNSGQWRWKSVFVGKTHLKDVDFSSLSDEDILSAFETILFWYYKQG